MWKHDPFVVSVAAEADRVATVTALHTGAPHAAGTDTVVKPIEAATDGRATLPKGLAELTARLVARVLRDRDGDLSASECATLTSLSRVSSRRYRPQTVDRRDDPDLWSLLAASENAGQGPCLINTSFNDESEPIVCTPRDAVRTFYGTSIDALRIGPFLLRKAS